MNSKEGSVLIVSLWMLSLFSVFMTNLSFQGIQHIDLMKRELRGLEAKVDFDSALGLVSQAILTDPKPHEDSKEDSWYGTLSLPEPWKNKMEVTVGDEESKINLNYASEELLTAFLRVFEQEVTGLRTERKDLVKQILKRRSKERIQSFEELFLLEDVETEDLFKLEPYLTVYPDSFQINVNTAEPMILKSVIESVSEDHLAGDELFRKITEYRAETKGIQAAPFQSDDLSPGAFQRKLKLSTSLSMIALLNRFLPLMTTDSRTYHLKIKTVSGREVEATLKDKAEGLGTLVLSWNEA